MRLSQANENRQRTSGPQATAPCRTQETDNSLKLRFPKTSRLLKSDEFRRIKKYGRRIVAQTVVFDILIEKSPYQKLGLTVSRHFGSAHRRNRFKRLVREAFRLNQHKLPPISIHVSPSKTGLMPTLKTLIDDFMTLC